MNLFIKFFNSPFKEKTILFETLLYLFYTRLLLLLPFRWIAPGLGKHMVETPYDIPNEYITAIRSVRQAVNRLSNRTPWKSTCLVQAITGKKMLKRRGILTTLYLGVAKEKDNNNKMKAHAWLRCGKIILTGREGHKQFTIVSLFG